MDRPRQAIIRDLTRAATSLRIDWDVRPAFDFIFSLYPDAGSTDEMPPPIARGWPRAARRSSGGPAVIDGALEADLAIHAGVLLLDHPDARSSADVVEVIAAVEAAATWPGACSPSSPADEIGNLIQRAIDGESDALPGLAECLPEWIHKGRLGLLGRPVRVAGPDPGRPSSLAAAVRGDRVARNGDPRARLRRPRARSRATRRRRSRRGNHRRRALPARAGHLPRGPRPSYFSRPYNFLMSVRDMAVFRLPGRGQRPRTRPNDLTPPLSVVRLHRALGDETRLRILKLLSIARPVPDGDRPGCSTCRSRRSSTIWSSSVPRAWSR